ncbi:MAG: hypothetical protein M0D57_03760 [Sphingobacteriales bacterium JAD_PAG50586_3]|nr:MAG: hypothetical protein M0D57_03760 [Sphingobacteriales bacterium JAD_PAG50586_3]
MAITWFAAVKEVSGLFKDIGGLVTKSNATKKLLLSEVELNLKQFQNAYKTKATYDQLIEVLSNTRTTKAREDAFIFSTIKAGKIKESHIKDPRNKRYAGEDCEWLFINIADKIEELKGLKKMNGTLEGITTMNVPLQFSNLFYKLKLLVAFVKS